MSRPQVCTSMEFFSRGFPRFRLIELTFASSEKTCVEIRAVYRPSCGRKFLRSHKAVHRRVALPILSYIVWNPTAPSLMSISVCFLAFVWLICIVCALWFLCVWRPHNRPKGGDNLLWLRWQVCMYLEVGEMISPSISRVVAFAQLLRDSYKQAVMRDPSASLHSSCCPAFGWKIQGTTSWKNQKLRLLQIFQIYP